MGSSRARLTGCAVVFAASVGVYLNAFGNGFTFDDLPLIIHNEFVSDLALLPRLFASDFWAPHGGSGLYRPLVTSSYALERAAFGVDPAGYRSLNLLLHAGVSVMALLLVNRLGRDLPVAIATGLLFAVHSVHTEMVASITTGRPGLLVAFLVLAALLLHVRADDVPSRRSWLRAGSLACFGLALLSKESAVTAIGLVVLVDWVRSDSGPITLRSLARTATAEWRVYALWAVVVLAYFVARYAVLGTLTSERAPSFVDNPLAYQMVIWRIVNAVAILGRYLWVFLAPLDLSHDYSYDHVPLLLSPSDPGVWGALALAIAALALLLVCARRSRMGFLAFGWFAATFSVGSNLIIPITAIMAERLLYLPSFALCLGLALALATAARRLPLAERGQAAAFAFLVAVPVAFNAIRTVERNPDWQSNFTIRTTDLARHPRNAKLQTNVGFSHLEAGDPQAALPYFEAAVAIVGEPDRFPAAYRGEIWALIGVGRRAEARALYRQVRAHVRDPYIESALAGRTRFPGAKTAPTQPR